jgi:hypothetical protein
VACVCVQCESACERTTRPEQQKKDLVMTKIEAVSWANCFKQCTTQLRHFFKYELLYEVRAWLLR